jgi:hypothetical protein
MMDIIELLTGQMHDPSVLNQLGQSVGAEPSQVQQLAELGLPMIMEMLGRNASTPDGAQALASALDQHQDANIDDFASFFKTADTEDGAKILQHVFTDKNERAQNSLAKQTGLDMTQVIGLLTRFAPLILGLLGSQKKAQGLDSSGVAGLTSALTEGLGKSGSGGLLSVVAQLLDAQDN